MHLTIYPAVGFFFSHRIASNQLIQICGEVLLFFCWVQSFWVGGGSMRTTGIQPDGLVNQSNEFREVERATELFVDSQ